MKKILFTFVFVVSSMFASTNSNKEKSKTNFQKEKTELLKSLKNKNDSKDKFLCIQKSKNQNELNNCKNIKIIKKDKINETKEKIKPSLNLVKSKHKLNLSESKKNIKINKQ